MQQAVKQFERKFMRRGPCDAVGFAPYGQGCEQIVDAHDWSGVRACWRKANYTMPDGQRLCWQHARAWEANCRKEAAE